MTSIEQKRRQYQDDGFYIYSEPILPADVVERAVEGMDAVRAGEYDTCVPPQPSRWNPGDDPQALCKIEMPQMANKAIMDLVGHAALGEAVAAVTGASRVQVWWVQLLYKPFGKDQGGLNIGWHQDRQYWQIWEEGSELFTAWVALSEVGSDCGPMRFVRGSHRWGFLDQGDFSGQDLEALRQRVHVADESEWEEVETLLAPGGVSVHDCLTYHGSGPNLSGAPRRSFAVHMRSEKAEPVDKVRQGLTRFIDEPAYCPVIYSAA